jgi:transposase
MGVRRHQDIPVRGTVYADVPAAAKGLGVSEATVYGAIARGTLDQLGLGRGRRARMQAGVRDKIFPSVTAAAKHFDMTEGAVYKQISRGRADRIGLPRHVNPDRSVYATRCKPVEIGPLRFASRREASIELGFEESYVSAVLRRRSKVGMQKLVAAAMRLADARARDGRRAA